MISSLIIVAAGNGTRLKGEIPKQYIKIGNDTILNLTLKKFLNKDKIKHIQPVINKNHANIYYETIKSLQYQENYNKILSPCFGGIERSISVKLGLKKIAKLKNVPEKVLIHDAARPFVSDAIIRDILKKLDNYDAVFPGLSIVDAVWKIEKENFNILNNKNTYFRAQTPQGFNFKKIFDAHINNNEVWAYDDIYLAKKNNLKIAQILGSEFNIKITNPEDLKIAERFLK
tara:strand:+ start:184 stop:873 length:690 start_codon:yes stop_codon:yes gene_type:complete